MSKKKALVLIYLGATFVIISMFFCAMREVNCSVATGIFSSVVSLSGLYFMLYT